MEDYNKGGFNLKEDTSNYLPNTYENPNLDHIQTWSISQPLIEVKSPSSNRRFADIMMSPVRFTQRKFRAGGTSGSIFSLVAATLGAGTLTFGYAIKENGIAWGTFLIVFGAAISYYTGMLLVLASTHTNRHRYEDIALALYGKRFATFTSVMNLLCLMAFIMSYIVYVSF